MNMTFPVRRLALVAALTVAPGAAFAQEQEFEEEGEPVVAGSAAAKYKPPPEVLPTENKLTGDPAAIKEGNRLFQLYGCTGCHGANGGGGMCPSVIDDAWTFGGDDAALYKLLRGRHQGQKMPNYQSAFGLEDASKLLAWVRSKSVSGYNGKGAPPVLYDPKPKPGAAPDTLDGVELPKKNEIAKAELKKTLERGKKLWNLYNCQTCHGKEGIGPQPNPSIVDPVWVYGGDDQTLFAVLRGGMARQKMPAYGSSMSLDEAKALLAYVRSLYKGDPSTVTW